MQRESIECETDCLSRPVAGIDVAKSTLEVFIDRSMSSQPPVRLSLANSEPEIQKLLKQLLELNVRLVVTEATGRYHRRLAAVLLTAGVPTKVLNPQRSRDFAKSIGKLEKTDCVDAEVLAHYARGIDPKPDAAPNPQRIELSDLISRRRALVQQRIAETNRSHGQMPKLAARQVKAMLRLIEQQIEDLDRAIAKMIESNEDWHNKSQIIDSVPGIGPDSANQLVAALPELGKLNRQQIAKLVGVAPLARDSGPFKGKRTIGGGRGDIRTMLYMLAHNATLYCPRFQQFFERLRAQGKAHKVAMTACMRKLLITLNQMIKTNKPWEQPSAPEPTL
jgi:transposase